jgi:hypothetical protein
MNLPPVRTAMSSSMALRRSPKPGALTATLLMMPRILLTTRVASASPSTSSAMITSGRRCCATLLQHRDQVGGGADLLLVNEDVGVLDNRFHALRVGDEVGGDVALVELHAVHEVGGSGALALLDRDDAVLADLLDRIRDQAADLGSLPAMLATLATFSCRP